MSGAPDLSQLGHEERVELLIELERRRARIDAQQQRLLALMVSDPAPYPSAGEARAKEWVREEIACALAIAPRIAASRLHDAMDLVYRLPATLAAIEAGHITLMHGRVLVESVRGLDDQTTAEIEARVLPRAAGKTVGQFRQAVKRAALALDPRAAEAKHRDAYADRRVGCYPEENGMATVVSFLRADHASDVMNAVDTRATAMAGDGDERTIEQRRADALVELITGGGVSTARQGPAVNVCVALSTLLCLDKQPGELEGYGPIPAAMARDIAVRPDARWRRLITDDHGRLLDYGRRTYEPPPALADHIRAHDQTCRFPPCNRPARHCDLDHVIAWADGGATSDTNLQALCERNHVMKHQAGWQVTRLPDGTTDWISPTGHRYQKPPETLPIDTTPTTLNKQPETDPDPPPF